MYSFGYNSLSILPCSKRYYYLINIHQVIWVILKKWILSLNDVSMLCFQIVGSNGVLNSVEVTYDSNAHSNSIFHVSTNFFLWIPCHGFRSHFPILLTRKIIWQNAILNDMWELKCSFETLTVYFFTWIIKLIRSNKYSL